MLGLSLQENRFWGVIRAYWEGSRGEGEPQESRLLMLRRSQWDMLHELVKVYGLPPVDVASPLIKVRPESGPGQALHNFTPKPDVQRIFIQCGYPRG